MIMIQLGKHIKCVFRNGTVVEGIVEEWSSTQVQLRSITDQSLLVIMAPKEDLMLVKVVAEPDIKKDLQPIQERIHAKLQEAVQPTHNPELQKYNIAELKQLAMEQEKQMITNKIREHFPGGSTIKKNNYISQIAALTGKRANG